MARHVLFVVLLTFGALAGSDQTFWQFQAALLLNVSNKMFCGRGICCFVFPEANPSHKKDTGHNQQSKASRKTSPWNPKKPSIHYEPFPKSQSLKQTGNPFALPFVCSFWGLQVPWATATSTCLFKTRHHSAEVKRPMKTGRRQWHQRISRWTTTSWATWRFRGKGKSLEQDPPSKGCFHVFKVILDLTP